MKRRSGYTLIELLVVIGIILVVSSLGLLIVAGTSTTQKVSNATELLQGKLLLARMQAVSEQTPRGVRLVQGSDGFVRQALLIEQAPSLWGGNATVGASPAAGFGGSAYQVTFDQLDLTGGFTSPDQWRVQPGDSFLFNGKTVGSLGSLGPYTILAIQSTTPTGGGTVLINVPSAPSSGLLGNSSPNFAIIRANRPLAGEDPITMPDGVAIDLVDLTPAGQNLSQIVPERYLFSTAAMVTLAAYLPAADMTQLQQIAGGSFTPADLQTELSALGLIGDAGTIQLYTGVYDIMFGANGRVMGQNGGLGKVILWVRDTSAPVPPPPYPLPVPPPLGSAPSPPYSNPLPYSVPARLMVIYTQTGLIAAQDVNRSNNYANPFSFTQDGMSCGL